MKTMKKILALALLLSLLYSCSHSVTPYEAASHHYNKCKDMR
jgi:PBP1b-binding outer membrane lipoprotein LpoB